MTDFTPQSSDVQKTSGTRENRDVYSGSYNTIGQVLATQSVGYQSTFVVLELEDVGLANSIVDVDVWMREPTDVGGGVSQYNFYKLPFTRYLGNGTVSDSAFSDVYYQANTPKGPDSSFIGPATLSITYRNNVTATSYPIFYYKISNRQVLA